MVHMLLPFGTLYPQVFCILANQSGHLHGLCLQAQVFEGARMGPGPTGPFFPKPSRPWSHGDMDGCAAEPQTLLTSALAGAKNYRPHERRRVLRMLHVNRT